VLSMCKVKEECLEKKKEGGGEAHISEAQKRNVKVEGAEDGTSLMLTSSAKEQSI
jgi:hypothetical protein